MPDLIYLNTIVLTSAFVVAFFLGFGMQRTQFCSMGAISDVLLMQSWSRAHQWSVALAIAVLGTSIMHASAWIDIHQTIYTSTKLLWLSHLIGGILFGIGMSIASGCGAKNLVRLGGGSLKSLIVLLVAGVFAQMTLRGIFAVIRVGSVDQVYLQLPVYQDLASLLHLMIPMDSSILGVWISSLFALGLLFFALKNTEFRQHGQWWISVLVGISILIFWGISGHIGYVAENPNTLEPLFVATNSGKMESASLTAPMAYWLDYLTLFSDTSKTISFAMIIAAGIALGSCGSAILRREWRLQGFSSAQDTMNHIIGGALMGVGGVTALGCTFGQGLSGMSTLALSSFITVAGFVIGVSLGLRYLERSAN